MQNLLTTAQAAEKLQITRQTIIAYAKSGKIVGSFIAKKWRFSADDLDAFISGARRSN